MKKYLLTLLSVLTLSFVMAQTRTVTGTITDAESGEAIPGANVVEKGTSNGTITDFDGNYQLTVNDGATLVFSFVGYESIEQVVGARGVIDVSLGLDVQALSEVVVVGYGTQEKKEITSAVASVKAEDFNGGLVNNPAQLIQGKVGGLTVARPGGNPNGSYAIRLRGVPSFGANAEPLIVIDGLIGGSLNSVDPNDIESIDVLKDGSAAAIYGTRGSAGVILITTKSGKAGTAKINYNGTVTVEEVANTIEFLSADEYRALPSDITTVDLGSSTNWLEEVTKTAISQVHNISLSGGSQQTTYRASVNVRDVEGVGLNSGFNQVNARLNLSQKALNDHLTITPILSMTAKDAEFGFEESFRYAIISNPTMPVDFNGAAGITDVGGYAERDIFDWFNPVSIGAQNINEGTDLRLLGSMKLEYDFFDYVDGLRVGVFYSQQRESDERYRYWPRTAKWIGQNAGGRAERSSEERINELIEFTVNYDANVGDLGIAFLGGYSYQDFFNRGFFIQAGRFTTDATTYNDLPGALDFNNGLANPDSYANSNELEAVFGRINLNYDDTYFLSASVRNEGSSRFGTENKRGSFPAVSAGVNIDRLTTIPGVQSLKLRASYGVTGQQPGESYLSLLRIQSTGTYFENGNYLPSFAPTINANPDLKWEVKEEIDLGFDFVALDGKLSGSFDWYQRNTTDLLFFANVPTPPNLAPQTWLNFGELENTGIDFSLDFAAVNTGDFTWTTAVNYGSFKTTVVELENENTVIRTANMGSPGQNATDLVIVRPGEPLGQIFTIVFDGFDEEGLIQVKDIDGDGNADRTSDNDRDVVGNGLPAFTLGWNNTFSYKSFDLNFFFRGAFGHDLLNTYRGFYENYQGTTTVNYNVVKGPGLSLNNRDAAVNDTHVEDASFIRLDNATLGYTLPAADGIGISKIRIFTAVQNLFTITNYSGIDPEVRYTDTLDPNNPNAFAPGIERRNTYFTTRQFTFGLQVEF